MSNDIANLNDNNVNSRDSITVELNDAAVTRSSAKKLKNSKLNLCISKLENTNVNHIEEKRNDQINELNETEINENEYNSKGSDEEEQDEYADNEEEDYVNSDETSKQFLINDYSTFQNEFEESFESNQNETLNKPIDENKNKRKRGHKQNSSSGRTINDNYSNYEMYRNSEIIQVNCNSFIGELHKSKFGSGGKGNCIKVMVDSKDDETNEISQIEKWMTPIEFEMYCGKSNCRDWKRTIKVGGQSLITLMENDILICHAVSCSCAACNKNESLIGPIRPFMRYRRRKKDEILAQNAFKKFLSLKPPTLLQDSLQKIQNNNQTLINSNAIHDTNSKNNNHFKLPSQLFNTTLPSFIDQSDSNQTVSSPLPILSDDQTSHPTSTFNNNKQIIKNSLENQKDFATCLEEFEESEEKKWIILEQEVDRLNTQAQTLHTLIQQTRKQSELNRQILIKKFFNNV